MMSQTDVDILNKLLRDKYGSDIVTGLPIWRIVWAEDQTEKQLDDFQDWTEGGLYIRTVREVREIKKYPHVIGFHILEQLVQVPEINKEQLVGAKISYELMFVFWNKKGEYLPPKFEVCEFVIETVLAAKHGTGNLKKYTDPAGTTEKFKEQQRKRVDEIIEYIWGEDAAFHDQAREGSAILMPSNYQRSV
jgi:hypothetical protein